jgi:hypothetical protein
MNTPLPKLRDKKPNQPKGTWIDEEDFDRIWDEVCDWFDKNIDRFVNNIQQVYALTGNEVGYSALLENWERLREWKGVGDVPQFSAEDIRKNIIEKMYGPLVRLWIENEYGQPRNFSQGYTGLMVTFILNVNKGNHDDFRFSYNFNLSLNIGAGVHGVL